MRLIVIAALIAALPWSVSAAPTWQTVSAEPGKRIELDRTSIKRDENGKVTATGRILLEKELPDPKSGGSYRVIEATTIYDCAARNAATIRRVFKKSETEILRDEEQKPVEMPVRSGTLDDKVLREVCRPSRTDPKEAAQKASEAGAQLKKANDDLLKAEAGKVQPVKAAEKLTEKPLEKAPEKTPEKTPVKVPEKSAPAKAAPKTLTSVAEERHPPPAPPVVKAEPKARHAKVVSAVEKPHYADPAVEHSRLHWSYDGETGPDNWARLDPRNSLCASGQRQSPIDIHDGIKVDLEPIKFDYKPSTFRIVDNGHTIQVTPGQGSITLTGKTYELVEFHFHKPSEERIDGRGFDMVAHLVHRADDGKVAEVAVLLEAGAENPFIQTLWNNLPLEKNTEVFPPAATIDLNAFLPSKRDYYTYMGSLTTPPCTEGVLWLVLRQPVSVSPEQIAIFSRLYRNNARPIQSGWGRLIKESR